MTRREKSPGTVAADIYILYIHIYCTLLFGPERRCIYADVLRRVNRQSQSHSSEVLRRVHTIDRIDLTLRTPPSGAHGFFPTIAPFVIVKRKKKTLLDLILTPATFLSALAALSISRHPPFRFSGPAWRAIIRANHSPMLYQKRGAAVSPSFSSRWEGNSKGAETRRRALPSRARSVGAELVQ